MVIRREEERRRIKVEGDVPEDGERQQKIIQQGDSRVAVLPATWIKRVAASKINLTLITSPGGNPLKSAILIEFEEGS